MQTTLAPVSASALAAYTALPKASDAVRAKIDGAAQQFESQFLSVMLGEMFKGVEAPAPFGGGEGEQAFQSFMTDAFAKAVSTHGGLGLAKDVSKAMLKMQGLS
jgi:Rod binding domain-containing protein